LEEIKFNHKSAGTIKKWAALAANAKERRRKQPQASLQRKRVVA
jgi:hypothetical protein